LIRLRYRQARQQKAYCRRYDECPLHAMLFPHWLTEIIIAVRNPTDTPKPRPLWNHKIGSALRRSMIHDNRQGVDTVLRQLAPARCQGNKPR
jgi:hypothetical protein